MNYETKDGGKEHYNAIIAQYNAIYAECFENAGKAAHDGDAKAVKALALFAAGAVDTLEVMDQALYEIFARIREMYIHLSFGVIPDNKIIVSNFRPSL